MKKSLLALLFVTVLALGATAPEAHAATSSGMKPVTRGYFAKKVVMGAKISIYTGNDRLCNDLVPDSSFFPYASALVDMGVMKCTGGQFRANDTINHAEAAKIFSLAFHLKSDRLTQAINISDLDQKAWYYDYVENLVANGIIENNRRFRPASNLTMDELKTWLSNVGGTSSPIIPTSNDVIFNVGINDYPDHNPGRPISGYINMYTVTIQANAQYQGSLLETRVVSASGAQFIVRPDQIVNFVTFKTEAAANRAITWSFNTPPFKNFTNPYKRKMCTINYQDTGSPLNYDWKNSCVTGTQLPYSDNDSLTNNLYYPSDTGNTLSVTLNPYTPAATTLPQGATNIPLMTLDLHAGAQEVNLWNIVFTRGGIGQASDWQTLNLYNGSLKLTSDRTVNSANDTVSFPLNLTVHAWDTKTLTLKGTLQSYATPGNSHYFYISRSGDVVGSALQISGDFPLSGNSFYMGSYSPPYTQPYLVCPSPYVYYQGACVNQFPTCSSWPSYAASCVDKIENGVRTDRYSFTCQNGYQRYGSQCVSAKSSFFVTNVGASVSPSSMNTTCPVTTQKTFQFTGTITANTSGVVTFYWERSDGKPTTQSTITFNGAGTQTVTDSWTVTNGNTMNGWEKLRVIGPNVVNSDPASFSLWCTTPPAFQVTNITAAVSPANSTVSCPASNQNFNFNAAVTVNGPGNVTYQWERSDGVFSPVYSLYFSKLGSQSLAYNWGYAGNAFSGWARLHVLTPNSIYSNAPTFVMTCAPTTVFSVTGVTASVSPSAINAVCPVMNNQFVFSGAITTNAAGNVTYQWERSDGVLSPSSNLYFYSAGTQYLNYSWNISGSGFSGWARLRILTPNVTYSNSPTFALNCSTVSNSGSVAQWKADGNASDSKGVSGGTLYGGASYDTGKTGQAFRFDGVNGDMVAFNNSTLNISGPNSKMSFEFWFKADSLGPNAPEWQALLYKGDNAANTTECSVAYCYDRQYSLWLNKDGHLHFSATSANNIGVGTTTIQTAAGLVSPGSSWHHVAGTINSATGVMRLYFDGYMQANGSFSTSGIRSANGPLILGSSSGLAPNNSPFKGEIDEVQLFNTELDPQAVMNDWYYNQ